MTDSAEIGLADQAAELGDQLWFGGGKADSRSPCYLAVALRFRLAGSVLAAPPQGFPWGAL